MVVVVVGFAVVVVVTVVASLGASYSRTMDSTVAVWESHHQRPNIISLSILIELPKLDTSNTRVPLVPMDWDLSTCCQSLVVEKPAALTTVPMLEPFFRFTVTFLRTASEGR